MHKAHQEKSSASKTGHTTVGEFASRVGIPAPDVYRLVDAGVIRTVDVGADGFRRRVIPEAEVERLRREGLPRR